VQAYMADTTLYKKVHLLAYHILSPNSIIFNTVFF
jgi:hypothetical protein